MNISDELVARITQAAAWGRELSAREEANALQADPDLSDDWAALDDERGEIIYALGELADQERDELRDGGIGNSRPQ